MHGGYETVTVELEHSLLPKHFKGAIMDKYKVTEGVELILTGLFGDMWELDPNLENTADRVTRAYAELLKYSDYHTRSKEISKCFLSIFPSKHSDIIFAPNITAHSMCPHHLLPVTYNMTIAYIPSKKGNVIGASKLERLARIIAADAILQEDLTHNIAQVISEYLVPTGVAVVTSGIHDCMRVRGIKTQGTFEVSTMRGSFKDNPDTRAEFFSLMQLAELRRK